MPILEKEIRTNQLMTKTKHDLIALINQLEHKILFLKYDTNKLKNNIITPTITKTHWTPITTTELLPEDGTYLCTLDGELCGQKEPFTSICGIRNKKWDEGDSVLAWAPMPDAYNVLAWSPIPDAHKSHHDQNNKIIPTAQEDSDENPHTVDTTEFIPNAMLHMLENRPYQLEQTTCTDCLYQSDKPNQMAMICLDCKRQYIGQEIEYSKPDRKMICKEQCEGHTATCPAFDKPKCHYKL